MYCEKLHNIYQHKDSPKNLIDERVIYKLDDYLKNQVTFRERQNLNPINFSIDMNVQYKTALMTFIIGTRVELFKIRTFFTCEECGEQQELATLETIECECGAKGAYQELKDQIKLYFTLLEKPQPCDFNIKFENQVDLLSETDIKQFNELSLSDIEKVGGSALLNEVVENSIRTQREERMKRYLGREFEII